MHICMLIQAEETEFNKFFHHAHADKEEKVMLALKVASTWGLNEA